MILQLRYEGRHGFIVHETGRINNSRSYVWSLFAERETYMRVPFLIFRFVSFQQNPRNSLGYRLFHEFTLNT